MRFAACTALARTLLACAFLAGNASALPAFAEDETPSSSPRVLSYAPASGTDPVVVVISGNTGTGTDAQAAPTAKPGKVVVLGFSQGGGAALVYATAMQRSVARVIVWYPLTRVPVTSQRLAERIKVPVLMFAGGRDHYHDCCLIETAHELEAAAAEAKVPFELVVYPDADHGFNHHGRDDLPGDSANAWKRTQERLAQLSPLQ